MFLGSLNALLAATALFVVGHFFLSAQPQRSILTERLGRNGFRTAYSLLMALAFVWMLLAYGRAPYVELWRPPVVFDWLAVVVMPFAFLFLVGSLTTPNPTAVGGERFLRDSATAAEGHGILTVTRHPMLWAFALWAGVHLLANGDAATVILSGGILALSLGGMWHIDRRRATELGSDWGPFMMTTSRLPLAAVVERRTRIDWAGIGLWRVTLALVLYVALLWLHPRLFGMPALPG